VYQKEYYKNNPDKVLVKAATRRSRKIRATIILFTKEQLTDRMSLWNGYCAYCGKQFTDNKLWEEIDHVIPLSRNGLHILANLRPTCRFCNRSKGAKLLSEWKNNK
jgi:5-methylcytosine-specific restriction endonuclease McrA